MTADKIRRYLAGACPGATATVVLCRPPGWVLAVIVLAFLACGLLADLLRHRMLLAVLDRAPAGTVVSLEPAAGARGMHVRIGGGPANPPHKAEDGPIPESE